MVGQRYRNRSRFNSPRTSSGAAQIVSAVCLIFAVVFATTAGNVLESRRRLSDEDRVDPNTRARFAASSEAALVDPALDHFAALAGSNAQIFHPSGVEWGLADGRMKPFVDLAALDHRFLPSELPGWRLDSVGLSIDPLKGDEFFVLRSGVPQIGEYAVAVLPQLLEVSYMPYQSGVRSLQKIDLPPSGTVPIDIRRSGDDLVISVGGEILHRAVGSGNHGRIVVHSRVPRFKVVRLSVTGERHGAPVRWNSPS